MCFSGISHSFSLKYATSSVLLNLDNETWNFDNSILQSLTKWVFVSFGLDFQNNKTYILLYRETLVYYQLIYPEIPYNFKEASFFIGATNEKLPGFDYPEHCNCFLKNFNVLIGEFYEKKDIILEFKRNYLSS